METRGKFEALPEIEEILKYKEQSYFDKNTGEYVSLYSYKTGFLNGAWMAFQEQQKIINMQECGANQIIEILNNFKSSEKPASFYLRKIKELLK